MNVQNVGATRVERLQNLSVIFIGSPKAMSNIKVKVQDAVMVNGQIKVPDENGEIEIPQELAKSLGLIEAEPPKTAAKAKQNATTED